MCSSSTEFRSATKVSFDYSCAYLCELFITRIHIVVYPKQKKDLKLPLRSKALKLAMQSEATTDGLRVQVVEEARCKGSESTTYAHTITFHHGCFGVHFATGMRNRPLSLPS